MGRAEFDPYGNVIANTIPLDLTDRLFTGQRFDPNTGLYDYRARFYDPLTGSFVQPDSIVPSPMDPRAWNRFSYVYGNPVNYTDPSGHIPILPLIGVAVIAGGLNVGIGAGAAYLSGEEYTIGDMGVDFTVGAVFGLLGFGVGARFSLALSRVPSYGILSVGEGMASAYWKGDEFTTNDALWAFGTGIFFAGAAELGVRYVSRVGKKQGWGIADEEYRKYFDSVQEHGGLWRMQPANKQVRVEVAKLMETDPSFYEYRNFRLASEYYENYKKFVAPLYKPNPANESVLLKTTVWGIGTFAGDNEYSGIYKPQLIRNPAILLPGR